MNLSSVIRESFGQVLIHNQTEVKVYKTGRVFSALIVSAEFMADFTMGDQENTEAIQGTCYIQDAPKTGDILIIEGKKYMTQTIQSRVNGPIIKFTANLK